MSNTLYYGDNLDILRRYIKDESIDLVYLDPPFNSNANYNVLFAEKDGSRAASQIRAFDDTWTWDQEDEAVYAELVVKGGKVADVLQAFRTFLGPCDLLAYLVMMAPRLIELHRVMKPTASIYLHCDPTASHYLKILMDAVFGSKAFRNEIIWHYSGWNKILKSNFESRHDIIFFYAKHDNYFNGFSIPWESEDEYIKVRKQKVHLDEDNRKYVLSDAGGGKRIRRYIDEAMALGSPVDDVWDIDKLNSSSKEKLGYPTQKPEILLERIIMASCPEKGIVLDPFCGCGTTVAAAQKLGRTWLGIDITYLAINLIKNRLSSTFGERELRDGTIQPPVKYSVIGEPTSVPDAEALAESDKYQFQWWALGLVGARPEEQKKGADKGIDGKIVFQGSTPGVFENVIISVKAGQNVGVSMVRDLKGVLDREKASIGVFISIVEPTKPMKVEAAEAGFYESEMYLKKYPKIQLLTVADLLAGKQIDMPPIRQVQATFKKAPKVEEKEIKQKSLF